MIRLGRKVIWYPKGKVNVVAGVALLLLSATMDSSPGNNAKQNIAIIRGLSQDMIEVAQALYTEMDNAENLLEPFDQYLRIAGK